MSKFYFLRVLCVLHIVFATTFVISFSSYAGGISNGKAFKLAENITADDYLPQIIVAKVKPLYRNSVNEVAVNNSVVQNVFNELQVSSFKKRFPAAKQPPINAETNEPMTNEWGAQFADLTPIYQL